MKIPRKTVSLRADLYHAAVAEAEHRGTTVTALVSRLIERELNWVVPVEESQIVMETRVHERDMTAEQVRSVVDYAPPDVDNVADPCRSEKCHIVGLHARHE